MELLKSIKTAMQFISNIQESCDKHRMCMEHIWLEEYNAYINEWKQSQIEQRKQIETKSPESTHVKDEDIEDLEELALADSLLKKARSIRMKNQKTINGIIDYRNLPTSSSVSGVPITKPTIQISEKMKAKKRIPQSKSDGTISRHRNTIVPRSKSASETLVPKENSKLCHNSKRFLSLSVKCSTVNPKKSSDKKFEDQTVISSKDLDALKRLHVSLPTCHEINPPKRSEVSDSSENSLEHQISPHPSSREFLNEVKGKLNSVSSHFKLKLWYPFLSSKSEIFLTSVECRTFCSVKKACTILYIIQETMMWIDLLYLMESEIYPNVIFDKKDMKKLRISSYLQSMFNPNGQRIPMLNPNR